MKLEKATCRIRCEMGACKNMAEYTIAMSRVGIRSRIHICRNCMESLYSAIGSEVLPKSIETVRPRKKAAEE